jgi:thymidylate synthase
MSFAWNFDSNTKLEDILFRLLETGPKHLREIAAELEIQLKNKSDKDRLKYRMRKIVDKNEDLQYLGYTSDGYIVPIYLDEFARLIRPLKSRGEGMLNKVELLQQGARKIGKRRENQPEQIDLFDDLFGTSK